MGKRAALAFLLSLLVIMSYNHFIAQKYPPTQTVTGPAPKAPFTPSAFTRPEEKLEVPAFSSLPASSQAWLQAKEIVVQSDLVRLVLTSSGARIKSCQLQQYPEEKINLQLVERQLADFEHALASAPADRREFLQREQDKLKLIQAKLAKDPQTAELVSLAATLDRDFAPLVILPQQADLSSRLNTALYQCAQDGLRLNPHSPQGQLEFIYSDQSGRSLKKTYTISNSSYIIGLDIAFSGWEERDFAPGHFLLYYGPDLGLAQIQPGRRVNIYQGPISCFQTGQQSWVLKESYTREEKDVFIRREHQNKGNIVWTGLENKYFLAALLPNALPAKAIVVEKNRFGEQKVALKIPYTGERQYRFNLYLGPKQAKQLQAANVTLEKSIDYGFFSPIARLIYQILILFNRGLHNFGWAIVLLSILVKALFYPLTHRSFAAMQKMQREMQAIQPEINSLRERLNDNPKKLNKEIMELYRKRGVHPLASCQSGCLPLLLQLPVFFALYAVLYNALELRGAPFLAWVSDLSAKDPYYILPVLMGLSMVVQNKLIGMSAASSAQHEQAKMMAILMPVMLTWVFASLPAGVVLYWLSFNLLTAGEQLLIKRKQAALDLASGGPRK